MKLAAMYSVFNATELLAGSIEQIYDHVDGICIAWQRISNRGEEIKEIDLIELFHLEKMKKVTLLEWQPNLNIQTKENERAKYQMRLEWAKKEGFTHYFTSATDHFYVPEEFAKAKKVCELTGFDVTFTKMFTYYKDPTWRLTPIEDYLMPFICELKPNTMVTATPYKNHRTDPSVRIAPVETLFEFPQDQIMMHHFSMVRWDIEHKFRNAAASVNWPQKIDGFVEEYHTYDIEENPGVSFFKGRKIEVVDDLFGLTELFNRPRVEPLTMRSASS